MRLQDIVDLGGTQEDIDFMKDVLTDDEQISTATASQNPKTKPIKECVVKEKIDVQALLKELSSFVETEIDTQVIQLNAFDDVFSQDEDEEHLVNDEIETEENTTKLIKEDESIKLVNKLESKAEKKERKRKEKMEKNLCKVELLDSATTSSETQFKDSKPIIQDLACDLISPILNPSKDSCIKTATENFEKIEQILSLKVLPKQTSKLIIDIEYSWYEQQGNVLVMPASINDNPPQLKDEQVKILFERAEKAYESELINYSKYIKKSSSDKEFIKTVLKSGTVTDRVSAITLLIQESPFHTLELLQKHLIPMATKKSRAQALLAIDSIKDLMITNILPNRKLSYFRDQGLSATNISNKHLAMWYFEDALKHLYFEFIKILEELAKDPLTHIKNKILFYCSDLLAAKPEQEQNLLSLLVNKLGDQDKKIASKVVHQLLKLLEEHPNMKLVVTKEVEHVLFRSNISRRTQYYAITFLNQIPLSKREADITCANLLVSLYFSLFESLVKGIRGEKKETKKTDKHKKVKPKHEKRNAAKGIVPKGVSKVVKDTDEVIDGIETKMLAGLLTGVNRAFPFSQIDDTEYTILQIYFIHSRFEKQINTLFMIAHLGTFNISTQAMTLIFQVQNQKQSLSDRFYRVLYESLFDTRLSISSKQSMYLNLLYKALKHDVSLNRIRAFMKRIIQICGFVQVPFACASLYLVSEIAKSHPGIWSLVDKMNEDEDSDEVIKDVVDIDDIVRVMTETPRTDCQEYDALKRDPLYANAENTYLYELLPLTRHFHPTLSFYATTLLKRTVIQVPVSAVHYDPLQNHTLSRFLDRFVYKNPKKVTTLNKGNSLMQPRANKNEDMLVAGGKKRNIIYKDAFTGKSEAFEESAVNSRQYDEHDYSKVPLDERFFFDFFKTKQSTKERKLNKIKVGENGSDEEEEGEGEEDEDDAMWNAIEGSNGYPLGMKDDDESDDDDDFPEDSDDMSEDGSQLGMDTLDMDASVIDFGEMDGIEGSSGDESDVDTGFNDLEGGDEVDSEGDMDKLFEVEKIGHGESEDVENADSVKKDEQLPRTSRKIEEKAKLLGFKGKFFKSGGTTFASASDFEHLLSKEEEAGESEDEKVDEDGEKIKKKHVVGSKPTNVERKRKSAMKKGVIKKRRN